MDRVSLDISGPFATEAMMGWTGNLRCAPWYADVPTPVWQAEWLFTFKDGAQVKEWRPVSDMVDGELRRRIEAAVALRAAGGAD